LPEPTPTLTGEEAKELFKKLRDSKYLGLVNELYKDTKGLTKKHDLVRILYRSTYI
jgi:hypothetical protein